MVCRKCGYQNSGDAVYCNGCGQILDRGTSFYNEHNNRIPKRNASEIKFALAFVLLWVEVVCFYYIVINAVIPFLMQGLIMVAGTNEGLRPMVKEINLLLGNFIHAVKDSQEIWTTAYGASINPSCSASSFERGLLIFIVCGVFMFGYLSRMIKTIVKLLKKFRREKH